jgi:hypothetical protein
MSKGMTRDGGAIIIEKKSLSDSAVLWYTGFVKFYGEEKARDYMKKLSAQKPAFRDSETIVTSELTEGAKLYRRTRVGATTTVNMWKSLERSFSSLRLRFPAIMARVAVYPGK